MTFWSIQLVPYATKKAAGSYRLFLEPSPPPNCLKKIISRVSLKKTREPNLPSLWLGSLIYDSKVTRGHVRKRMKQELGAQVLRSKGLHAPFHHRNSGARQHGLVSRTCT